MDAKTNGALPAHPTNDGHLSTSGLTKRELFATQCDPAVYSPFETFRIAKGRAPTVDEFAAYIAAIRVAEADALLAALTPESAP